MKWKTKRTICVPVFLILSLGVFSESFGRNLHLIDQLPNGFKLYRSGVPSKGDLREYEELGIQEMAVLSGDADRYELKYPELAPGLTVVYDHKQDDDVPLTVSFLQWFDRWVEDARATGKVIAFRCRCGCHRTGRLAAYYQMKYQNITADDAWVLLDKYGKNMWLHRNLKPQVRALEDYINEQPCSQNPEHCVIDDRNQPE
jgi:protein-tyrosine phosphatase